MTREVSSMNRLRILALAAFAALGPWSSHADTLGYSIYEGTGDFRVLLTTGSRDYTTNDLDVRPVFKPPVIRFWESAVDLEGGYRVGVFVPAGTERKGFGLWVRNDANPNEFSWNWFSHDGGQIYTKIKGTGRLRIQFVGEGRYAQMSTIEFLDDIELTYQQNMCTTPVGAVSHTVVVSRGSVLDVASHDMAQANLHKSRKNPPLCAKGTPGYERARER